MDKVSVIIPCFNVEEYVEECLASVYSQESKLIIEVIAIDNNSTDGTFEKLTALKRNKFPDLIILQELKKGANAARNKGLFTAQGDWIQFLDADDLIMPEKISHQMALIKKNDCDFIAGAHKKIKNNGDHKNKVIPALDQSIFRVFTNNTGTTCSNLFKKKTLLAVNGWDERLRSSQETDLMLRLMLNNASYKVDENPLTVIRERESGQISQSNPKKKWETYILVRSKLIEANDKKHIPEVEKHIDHFKSYILSSLLILATYKRVNLVDYSHLIPKKNKIILLGGVSQKVATLIKFFGYTFIFRVLYYKNKIRKGPKVL